jgi:hypothetical protein
LPILELEPDCYCRRFCPGDCAEWRQVKVYQGLGVGENQQLTVYGLVEPVQGYEALASSRLLLQLDVGLLAGFVGNANQTQAVKAYRRVLRNANP